MPNSSDGEARMPRESGYYPPGAEFDPNAPWNQPELDDEPCYCGNAKLLDADQCGECDGAEWGDYAYERNREMRDERW